eukprot:TRINITY_DN11549_c0_g2_i1.p1 TRINITY_DN11549_c0_g2~~TRINITY_DN11549_c0_g2_i1.p1  ORF type:complete len:681 (-),score=99.76 TRINITY_DN11549_c0_g2_i1:77-2119(-)
MKRSASANPTYGGGLLRSSSGQALTALRNIPVQASNAFHEESRWKAQGGWRSNSKETQQACRMERDASMVELLNLVDPDSLVDAKKASRSGQDGPMIPKYEQHSALSVRGVALVGGTSALGWYLLRLALRDVLGLRGTPRGKLVELHSLSTVHALAWVAFIVKKLRGPAVELPVHCSRALVASLGFYLHDCWALRFTFLSNPSIVAHQASIATMIMSILRSKGVAWLAPEMMSLAFPTVFQEILQFSGTLGLPSTRLEVRFLRLLWFASFAASKLALVPLWMRYAHLPELHQPTLLLGKISYLVGLVLNVRFLATAARDLPRFLRPAGETVSAAEAYSRPLMQARSASQALAASALLVMTFGSYMTAPLAAVLSLTAWKRRSRNLGLVAGGLSAVVVADSVVPQPKQFDPRVRIFSPLLNSVSKAFNHRFYADRPLTEVFHKDRHHLLAVTPHGFFPWGIAPIVFDLMELGYEPNFIGASVLGALPGAGRLLRTFGYRPATQKELRRCLDMPYPRNITVIVPGGIAEMFSMREDIEISQVSMRKGFLEVAIEKGAMVVPGYIFGHSQQYKVARGALGKAFEKISRSLKMSLNLFHGRWGTVLPYSHPLACALGSPIDTREICDVNEAHSYYLKNLRETYEENKADFGWADRQLFFEGEAMPKEPGDPLEAYSALPPLSKL